jgi:hypothetical protein
MKHYVSVSKYPGKQGQYFYTSFFKLHNLDADYTPLAVTEESLPEILHTAKSNGTCGISVSMPFKNNVIDYLDHKNLNLDVPFMDGKMCSTENLAIAIWNELANHLPETVKLHCVKLYETQRIYVEYFG